MAKIYVKACIALLVLGCSNKSGTPAPSPEPTPPGKETDAGTKTSPGAAKLVETAADLPTCAAEITGYLYYVKATSEFHYCDGSAFQTLNLVGAKGDDGAVGPAGPAGPSGTPGPQGDAGTPGAQGPAGISVPPSNTALVAATGGAYSTVDAAVSAVATWCPSPSASNRCVIRVAPGKYSLSAAVTLPDFVDLEGSGRTSTEIESTYNGSFCLTIGSSEIRDVLLSRTACVWLVSVAAGKVASIQNSKLQDNSTSANFSAVKNRGTLNVAQSEIYAGGSSGSATGIDTYSGTLQLYNSVIQFTDRTRNSSTAAINFVPDSGVTATSNLDMRNSKIVISSTSTDSCAVGIKANFTNTSANAAPTASTTPGTVTIVDSDILITNNNTNPSAADVFGIDAVGQSVDIKRSSVVVTLTNSTPITSSGVIAVSLRQGGITTSFPTPKLTITNSVIRETKTESTSNGGTVIQANGNSNNSYGVIPVVEVNQSLIYGDGVGTIFYSYFGGRNLTRVSNSTIQVGANSGCTKAFYYTDTVYLSNSSIISPGTTPGAGCITGNTAFYDNPDAQQTWVETVVIDNSKIDFGPLLAAANDVVIRMNPNTTGSSLIISNSLLTPSPNAPISAAGNVSTKRCLSTYKGTSTTVLNATCG